MTETFLKSKFELNNKFEPCFSSSCPIYLTETNKVFCGRLIDGSICINVLDGSSLDVIQKIQDDDLITTFAVDDSGSTVILATKNLLLKRLDENTYRPSKVWRSCHNRMVQTMALSRCSTRLATGSGDTVVRLWHIGPKEGFTASCRIHNSMITLLSFHPTLSYLFSSAIGNDYVAVWNSDTGVLVSKLEGHQSNITCIGFSSDARYIASCGRDKVVMIWLCSNFERLNVIPVFEGLEACLFLPHGALSNHLGEGLWKESTSLLLTGGQWGSLRVWNPENGRCVLEIRGPLDRVPLTCSGSKTSQSESDRHVIDYGLHSIVNMKLTHINGQINDTGNVSVVRVPKLVLTRQSNHVEFYDPMIAKLTSELLGDIGHVDQLCIAGKDKNFLILADASPHLKIFPNPPGIGLCDSRKNKLRDSCSWKCHLVPGGHTDVVLDFTVSSCGQWFASCSKDLSICLWHLVEGETKMAVKVELIAHLSNAHAAHATAICFNKTTTYLISGSEDNHLKVWNVKLDDLETATSVLTEWTVIHGAHSGAISSIDVSVNNQLVATGSRDKTIKIWKFCKRGLNCEGLLQGHRRGVWSVCFSTKEKVVLSAASDGDIKLWNLKDFSCMRTLEGHDNPVYKAVFLSNDKQILSCDQKGLLRLWNVAKLNQKPTVQGDEQEVNSTALDGSCVFKAHEGRILSMVVCPGETGFYTGGEDETLCYFQDCSEQFHLESAKQLEEFIQSQQVLDNLLHEKRYAEAVHFALKLDRSKCTLEIFQELLLSNVTSEAERNDDTHPMKCNSLLSALDYLLPNDYHKRTTTNTATDIDDHDVDGKGGDEDDLQLVKRLIGYAVNWNTRSCTALVGQYVLNWVLTRWTPQELLTWSNFHRQVESLLPYTLRHYQRLSRLEEQLAILDFLSDTIDQHGSQPMEIDQMSTEVSTEVV